MTQPLLVSIKQKVPLSLSVRLHLTHTGPLHTLSPSQAVLQRWVLAQISLIYH